MSSLNPQDKTNRIKIYQASFDFKKFIEKSVVMQKSKRVKKQIYVDTVEKYELRFSQKLYCVFKAVCDFFIALFALIILSPLFLIVAIAIKVDSKGPVFFVQKRLGKNGREFKCVKFRSMSQKANHNIAGYEYAEAESYITRVGKVIRALSIDELPQLYNILTFKMSLIGYRPSQSNETELNEMREKLGVHELVPGITGWAQINGRDVLAAHPTLKAEYDAYYLQKISFWFDIKIFFLTIFKILKKSDISEGVVSENADVSTENAVFAESEAAAADVGVTAEVSLSEGCKESAFIFNSNQAEDRKSAV